METDFHQIPLVFYAPAAATATVYRNGNDLGERRNGNRRTEWWKPGISLVDRREWLHERQPNYTQLVREDTTRFNIEEHRLDKARL